MSRTISINLAETSKALAILMLVLVGFAPRWCAAQVLYGSLVGNVKDESSAAVRGAERDITSKETNLTRRALSNEEGLYSFPNLLSGTYSVKVTMAGLRISCGTMCPWRSTAVFAWTSA